MATALFINRTDLVRNSIIDGNVDTDKFIQFIKMAQVLEIQNLMGTELYNQIGTMISDGSIDDVGNAKFKTLLNDWLNETPEFVFSNNKNTDSKCENLIEFVGGEAADDI